MDIYRQINDLRQQAHDEHTTAEGLDRYLLHELGEQDWTTDDTFGRTLGDPIADYCVSIDGDVVTVFAGGIEVAQATIEGAGSL